MARDQDALALCQLVADQVGNRMTLARSGRTLHQDGARFFEAVDHTFLFRIGVFRKEEVDLLRLGLVTLGSGSRLDPDDAQQRFGEVLLLGYEVDVFVDGFSKAKCSKAEEHMRSSV